MKSATSEKSIISVIKYGGILKLNNKYKKVDGLEVFYNNETTRDDKINFATNLLKKYFKVIDSILRSQKLNRDDISPREIGALIRLLRHFMTNSANRNLLTDLVSGIRKKEDSSEKKIKEILSKIKFNDVIKLNLSASNWAAVEGYMLKQIHKYPDYKKFGNKKILSSKGLKIYEEEDPFN